MSWIEEILLSFNQIDEYDRKNEYIGEDGLIHCSKCKDRLETALNDGAQIIKLRRACRCRKEKIQQLQERERQQEIERNRNECFSENNMHYCTFTNDDRKNDKISDAMIKYVSEFPVFKAGGKGILLYGDIGTGKTFYAACIANALIDQGHRVLMTNFARLTNVFQDKSFGYKQEYMDSLRNYSLLIIDDFGIERKSEYMLEVMFNVIDSRYRAGLPMIVTTNLNLNTMLGSTDTSYSRIYERITERCIPVEVKGESRRKSKVVKNLATDRAMLGL